VKRGDRGEIKQRHTRKVQFCTLLQVPTRLYGDSRNLNSYTASLHLQFAVEFSNTVTKRFERSFAAENVPDILICRNCVCLQLLGYGGPPYSRWRLVAEDSGRYDPVHAIFHDVTELKARKPCGAE
jgi:hypothetical protein